MVHVPSDCLSIACGKDREVRATCGRIFHRSAVEKSGLCTTAPCSHTCLEMGVTERLARASSRHPWRTFGAWLGAIVVALVLAVLFLPGNLTTTGHVTGNPESKQAEDLFARFPRDRNAVDELIVVRSPARTVTDPAFEAFVRNLLSQGEATGVVYRASTYYDSHDPSQLSRDRHATLIAVQRQEDVDPLLSVVDRNDGRDGFSVVMTGEGTLDHDFNELSQHDLKSGELQVGLPAALVILILAFGIDYSLFVVSRYREERTGGRPELDAIGAAGATASRAVLFSGTVFVIALTGMLLVPSNIMKSLAVAAITVGIVSVLAALTLLPALLGLLGDRVNALRVPFLGRSIGSVQEGRFWGAIVRAVMRRPLVSLLSFTALLLLAAAPAIGLSLGASGVSTLPDRLESKQGFEALSRDFPQTSSSPALIAVEGNVNSPPVRAGIARLRRELADDPVFGGSDLRVAPSGDVAAIGVQVGGDRTGSKALAAVRHLRSVEIPQAFNGTVHVVV